MPRFTSPLFNGRNTRSETAAASPVQFPRRYPRMGAPFQVLMRNIPALGDAISARPPPMLVAAPWVERHVDVEDDTDMDVTETADAAMGAVSTAAAATEASSFIVEAAVVGYGATSTSSDVAEHGPSTLDQLMRSDLPLPLLSPHVQLEHVEPTDWKQRLLDWHAAGTAATSASLELDATAQLPTRGRSSRSNSITNNNSSTGGGRRSSKRPNESCRPDLGFSAKRMAVEQQRLVVQWSGGKAALSLRRRQRSIKRQMTFERVSWRQEILGSSPYMLGDYRRSLAEGDDNGGGGGDDTSSGAVNDLLADEAHAGIAEYVILWMAVLEYAESLYKDVESPIRKGSARVRLSEICEFLYRVARELPPPEQVCDQSTCDDLDNSLWTLIHVCRRAQHHQAKLFDMFFEEGIDTDILKKQLDLVAKNGEVELDEMEEWSRQLVAVLDWQSRLDGAINKDEEDDAVSENVSPTRNDLCTLELYLKESMTHGFRSKVLLALEKKLDKAYELRDRALEWKGQSVTAPESTKVLGALVRDLIRLKLAFPEGSEILAFHREVECWIDRANVAIRSRISLQEISVLLERATVMNVNLSEYTEKLQFRVAVAEDWLGRVREELSCAENEEMSKFEWGRRVRQVLCEGVNPELLELSSEGSRMPVECDLVKIIQLEMDARAWSIKARKWIPNKEAVDDIASKRGKLEDLEEHLTKASALRERVCLPEYQIKDWVLDGEAELRNIVDDAHRWFDRHEELLDGDKRRNLERTRLSLEKLRRIVQENDSVYAILGSATAKVARILGLAEAWYEQYEPLLRRCGLLGNVLTNTDKVSLDELTAAVEASESDLPIELDEAAKIRDVAAQVQLWHDDCAYATGTSKKRSRRGKKFTLQRLIDLIEEAKVLPIDTNDDVYRLREQLALVTAWQANASSDLKAITSGFQHLQEAINETFGQPADYTRDKAKDGELTLVHNANSGGAVLFEEKKAADDLSHAETVSTTSSGHEIFSALAYINPGQCNVHVLIKNFAREASKTNLETPEGDIATELESVSRWCARSLRYLESQREIFDKRFFGAFDRFVAEGKALLSASGSRTAISGHAANFDQQRDAWKVVIRDQMLRLDIILGERSQFVEFCKNAEQLLQGDKRIPCEKLQKVVEKSRSFPSDCDVIKKLRKLNAKSQTWREEVKALMSTPGKLSMADAKMILDSGEKLGVLCDELKELRNGVKQARAWSQQVKRSSSATSSRDIDALLKEHDMLIVEMPEETAKLRSALCNYCICRRPFDGFMIACDTCDEWYHGPCIGVTESKAGKTEKYVCVRCSVVRAYKSSALGAVGLIRKWANDADRRRARQVDAQKLQRKIRKDNKDMASLKLEKVVLVNRLKEIESNATVTSGVANEGMIESTGIGIMLPDNVCAMVPKCCPTVPSQLVDDATITKPRPSTELNMISDSTASNHSAAPGNLDVKPSSVSVDLSSSTKQITPVSPGSKTETCSIIKAGVKQLDLTKGACETRLGKVQGSIEIIQKRLADLAATAAARRNEQELEDANTAALKEWCLEVLASALIPSVPATIDDSRPIDGSISTVMRKLVDEAKQEGLVRFKDIKDIIDNFESMAWCIRASSLLARRPTDTEVDSLVKLGSNITFLDDKAFRVVKSIRHRAKSWDGRVRKALAPVPGETRPFNLDTLKDLADIADDIPLTLPLQSRLGTVIDDNGSRHCLCGGPSDGRFMLCCDTCNKWFHGLCVGVKGMDFDEWSCPACAGAPEVTVESKILSDFHELFAIDEKEENGPGNGDDCDEDVATNAPTEKNLWPPFGLLESDKAKEALGSDFPPFTVSVDGKIQLSSQVTTLSPPRPPRPCEVRKSLPVKILPQASPAPKPQKSKPVKLPVKKPTPAVSTADAAMTQPAAPPPPPPPPAAKHAPIYPPTFSFPPPLPSHIMQNMMAWQHHAGMMPMHMRPSNSPAAAPSACTDHQQVSHPNAMPPPPPSSAPAVHHAIPGPALAQAASGYAAAAPPAPASTGSSLLSSGSLSLDALKKVAPAAPIFAGTAKRDAGPLNGTS